MRAYLYRSYGGPDVMQLATVPVPSAAPKSGYLIKIHAFSFNPIDFKRRSGALKALRPDTFPVILGYDASGTVEAVGEGASKFKVGDEVYLRIGQEFSQQGTAAEYTIALEKYVAAKPSNMSHEEAAAVPLAAVTALQMLRRAGFKAGDKVFISGGAGGVGTYAIQIAKALGASLVATSASSAKIPLLQSLGADEVVDYKTTKFAEVYKDRRFDIALDMTAECLDLFKVVKPGGSVASVVIAFSKESWTEAGKQGPGCEDLPSPGLFVRLFLWLSSRSLYNAASSASLSLYGVLLQPNALDLEELTKLVETGKLRSIIKDQVFTGVDASPEAFKLCESGRATGKIIVKVV